jgi:hypothetical protein
MPGSFTSGQKGSTMTIAKRAKTLGIAAALSVSALGTVVGSDTARADEQYFPLQSYRVGPYAAGGTGFFGGFIDYLNLINIRDARVNGDKLTWDECETQYEVERGVECYDRQKSHANIAAWNPLSVGIAYAMIDRITADKVPLITVNHGRTDSTDGRVFPYVFPLLLNPYSETRASSIISPAARVVSTGSRARRSSYFITARPMAARRSRSMSCSRKSTASPSTRSRCRIPATSSRRNGSRSDGKNRTMSFSAAGA